MFARLRFAFAAAAFALIAAAAGAASACCNAPPPPNCCAPPPPPRPPAGNPCCGGGHSVVTPGVNVNLSSTAIAISGASASARAGANAGGIVYIGGGGSWYVEQPPVGYIGALQVEVGAEAAAQARVAVQTTRSVRRRMVIQAVCIDDRSSPHPASQVHPDREIDDAFEGELFRCVAGTHMQAVFADYGDHVDFSGGQVLTCAKAEALYRRRDGDVVCRPQIPARDCNERSLLRRFGVGLKILTMTRSESITEWRETAASASASASASAMGMSLDGGVGGVR